MATLPTFYRLGTVAPRPATGAVDYKSGTGAEEIPGRAAAQFGETVQRVAFQQQDALNTTRAEDSWNQYKNSALDLATGDGGFATKKSGDAVNGNLYATYTGKLADARARLEGQMTDDDARRKFAERANVTDLQFKDQLLRHYTAERADYEQQTFEGSKAAAAAMVRAAPTDQGVFDLATVNLEKRAEALAAFKGITDPNLLGQTKADLKDGLMTQRLDAILYSNPIAADALFRLTEKEWSDPAKKLLMQSKLREASLGVQSANQADDILREVRATQPTARPEPGPAPLLTAGATKGKASFNVAVNALLAKEGGYNASDGKSGAPVNFGINQRANPDINVADLTRDQAIELYRTRYWNAIGGDNLEPATAMVALDAAALQGVAAAQKLITDSGGDPQTMLDLRRTQLANLAQRDPEQAKYLGTWTQRLDALQAQIGPPAPATSGLPDARDIRAQLPLVLAKVEERANKLYGNDTANPDRAAFIARTQNELRGKINLEASQLEAIQKQATGALIDYVAGFKGNAPITSFSQIQANPDVFRAWQQMDPSAKLYVERMVDSNASGDKGNDTLYWDVFKRIHADIGSPDKIDFYQQILPYAGPGKLNMTQIGQLRSEIDRNETPGGRSVGQLMRSSATKVEQYFKTHVMFTAQPDRQIAATMRWTEDAGKAVDAMIAAGHPEKVRDLFTLDSPDSLIAPKKLDTYVTSTPAAGLSAAAQAAQEAPQRLDPKNPLASYGSLKPGARYYDPDTGQVRIKGGAPAQPAPQAPAAAAPAPAAAPNYGNRTDGTPKGTDFFGELKRPDGRVSTELAVGITVDGKQREVPLLVPGLNQDEVNQLLTLPEGAPIPQQILDKAVEHARSRLAAGKDPFAAPGEPVVKPVAVPPKSAMPVLEETSLMDRRRMSADERQVQADERERMLKVALSAIPRRAGSAIVSGVQATGEGVRQAVAVPARIGSVIAQAVPTEQERYVSAFRQLLSSGKYRLQSADTIKAAMESGLLTNDEHEKAVAMMQTIAARARK